MNSVLVICGQNDHFCGNLRVSGAKNAALPELAAAILSDGIVTLEDVPYLADVASMITVLASMGISISLSGSRRLILDPKNMKNISPPSYWVQKIRASILLLGPLLAKNGYAKIAMPGGCNIGIRPILEHVAGLEALGAKVTIENNIITAVSSGLKGANIKMQSVSVGATENLIMAAVLAEGVTIIDNAACEPEVTDLSIMLNNMGAKITGYGTTTIQIEGVTSLASVNHTVMPDRIEAGTLLIAAAAARGEICLDNFPVQNLRILLEKLEQAGAIITSENNSVKLTMLNNQPRAVSISTEVYPGFPTDLQPQWAALTAVSNGQATITENIFDNRLQHAPELVKMGANIHVNGNELIINGVDKLNACNVIATDLRAAAGLTVAGIVALGNTQLVNAHYLDRGYDCFEQKLTACGVNLFRKVEMNHAK